MDHGDIGNRCSVAADPVGHEEVSRWRWLLLRVQRTLT
jgi:hypothetical protein